MRTTLATAAFALALATPALAVDWTQNDWQGGAVSASTTSQTAGWTGYDFQDGGVVVLSTGLQSVLLSSSWTQTDASVSTAGFYLAGSAFSNSHVVVNGSSVSVQLAGNETITTKVATIPHQRSAMAISTFPATGKIYLFGGRNNDDGSLSNQILQYDPMTDTIGVMPTVLPSSADFIEAAYAPNTNKIYLFGGYDGCTEPCGLSSIWQYDPISGVISTMTATLPTGRFGGAAAYYPGNGDIYYFGGAQVLPSSLALGATVYHQVLKYDPTADTLGVDPASIPNGLTYCQAYFVSSYAPSTNKIYLYGGASMDPPGHFDCGFIPFDVSLDTFEPDLGSISGGIVPSLAYHPATGNLYFFGGGGTAATGSGSQDLGEFATASGMTQEPALFRLPQKFYDDPAAYYAGTGSIFIFGGGNTFSQIWEYKFNASGNYTSAVYDTGNTASLGKVSWSPVTQSTTAVALTVGVRTGPTPTPDSSWTNGGAFSTVSNGASLAAFSPNRYVQYIATFTTTLVSSGPELDDVSFTYSNYPSSSSLVSSAFDTGGASNAIQKVSWLGLFPSGATAEFQIRTASDNGSGLPGTWGPWLGPTSGSDYYADQSGAQAINSAQRDGVDDRWFQYKAVLVSTDVFATPTLGTVTVTTNLMPTAPLLDALMADASTQLTATLTDESANEDEFVVSSGTVSGPANVGTTVTTLNQAGIGGSQTAAIPGLQPNTTYFVRLRAYRQPPVALYSPYSAELSLATLAAPPTLAAVSAIHSSSATLAWNADNNPAGTPYEVSMSTDDFNLNASTPVPFASSLTANTTTLYGLSAGTTYYFRVRAENAAGTATAFAVASATPTLPGALGPPSGSPLGVSSISWTWSNTVGPVVQSYGVYSAASGLLLTGTTSTSYVQTALTANASYGVTVAAVDAAGEGPPSPAATTYTLAAAPSTNAFSAVYISSLTLTWNGGGNPAGTAFQIARSTDAVTFAVAASTPTTSYTDAGIGNATYYYEVRAVNGDGVASAYDAAVSAYLSGQAPSPPSGLILTSSSTAVTLKWNASPGPDLLQYDIYWDAGSGSIDYATTYSTVAASTTSFTSGLLSPGTYFFAVRAENADLLEDRNTNVKAAITLLSADPISDWMQTRVAYPASGKTVWGNAVTLDAALLRGSLAGITQVRFDYRASTAAAWAPVVANNSANPVLAPPFDLHWDVTGLTAGDYEVRAVARNALGVDDPAPPAANVTVGSTSPDATETLSGSSIQRSETVQNGVEGDVFLAGPDGTHNIEVKLPAGALGASTSTLIEITDPAPGLPAAPSDLVATGITVQIVLQNGQTALSGPALLAAAYQDADGDGLVDGTAARDDRLSFLVYRSADGSWKSENPTTLDLAQRTVSVASPHFSVFGVFAAAASALNNVRVYPNPYRPDDGDADDGVPYGAGDPDSGIIFDNLTQGARIRVYDATGALVWQTVSQVSSGKVQWDGRNESGRDAATGGYLAVVTDLATGRSVVKRIAIIRHR